MAFSGNLKENGSRHRSSGFFLALQPLHLAHRRFQAALALACGAPPGRLLPPRL